ncbi:Modification methylase DpnIIB [Sedimentisphaera cyanobacteriorum]|uniref:Methyltransferase n=1 Tax=Sedimentisphaera cyanobacteriorum TaxID=1940790 RepID=A0A1Q2HT23_9BACT|nr:DNA methyltransferase [Sedimentisphaera cyanobacteriorum]AQQ10475.1 Modification methylase DpnIIB [Sedimentisphaera cyanobacteriorum]
MAKFNDIDLSRWKEYEDIETDSLWIIERRDNSGKHDGFYHGNFVPQIPRQMIKRYTKTGEVVLDPFMGSGTTAFECEALGRNFAGIDINTDMVKYVKRSFESDHNTFSGVNFHYMLSSDSTDFAAFSEIAGYLASKGINKVSHVILHPPYYDILKFTDDSRDLSNSDSIDIFLNRFAKVLDNSLSLLENNRYVSIVIGDKYTKGQWIPLGFYCMQEAMNKGLTLKSIIVKNMAGNRAKQNKNTIWRYRALNSDYFIFKHEYILVLKKN